MGGFCASSGTPQKITFTPTLSATLPLPLVVCIHVRAYGVVYKYGTVVVVGESNTPEQHPWPSFLGLSWLANTAQTISATVNDVTTAATVETVTGDMTLGTPVDPVDSGGEAAGEGPSPWPSTSRPLRWPSPTWTPGRTGPT